MNLCCMRAGEKDQKSKLRSSWHYDIRCACVSVCICMFVYKNHTNERIYNVSVLRLQFIKLLAYFKKSASVYTYIVCIERFILLRTNLMNITCSWADGMYSILYLYGSEYSVFVFCRQADTIRPFYFWFFFLLHYCNLNSI